MLFLRTPHSALRTPYYFHASRITWVRTHRAALTSMLVVALLYIAALVAMPPEGLTHHDTGAKYLQVRNLRLTPSGLDWSINYPARPLDPHLDFVPFNPKQYEADSQGRIYLQWPIFLGLLTRIPWKLLGFWGLYTVPLTAGLGTLWAAYLLAQAVGLPRRIAWLSIPLVGLATPIAIYSLLFFEHTLASLLVTLSLLFWTTDDRRRTTVDGAESRRQKAEGSNLSAQNEVRNTSSSIVHRPSSLLSSVVRRPSSALSASLLAVAIYFRSELYVLAFVMLALYAFDAFRSHNWRPLLVWFAAFLLALVPLWAFYAITEGNILPLHATWYFAGGDSSSSPAAPSQGGLELPRLRYISQAGLGIIPDFLMGPQDPQKAPLSPTFPAWAIISALLGVALCAISSLARLSKFQFANSKSAWPLYTLAAGLVLTLLPTAATLFSPEPYYNLHGFLLASPFIILALFPGSKFKVQGPKSEAQTPHSAQDEGRSRTPHSTVLLYVGLHALIISSLSGLGPISRNEWGQRYLLPAYPALVVLALYAGWRIWTDHAPRVRSLALTCLLLGGLLTATGVGFTLRGYIMLSDERTQVVAWQALARTLPAREPLVTDTWWLPLNLAADFYTRPIMLAEGNDRMATWAAQMRSENVTAFGVMSPDPATLTGPWTTTALAAPVGPPQESRGMWLQRYFLRR